MSKSIERGKRGGSCGCSAWLGIVWWYRPWNRVKLIVTKNQVLLWEQTMPQYKAWWWMFVRGCVSVVSTDRNPNDHYWWVIVDA
jgi:hypothetical protein